MTVGGWIGSSCAEAFCLPGSGWCSSSCSSISGTGLGSWSHSGWISGHKFMSPSLSGGVGASASAAVCRREENKLGNRFLFSLLLLLPISTYYFHYSPIIAHYWPWPFHEVIRSNDVITEIKCNNGSNRTIITCYYHLLPIITPKKTGWGGWAPRPGFFEVYYYPLLPITAYYYELLPLLPLLLIIDPTYYYSLLLHYYVLWPINQVYNEK